MRNVAPLVAFLGLALASVPADAAGDLTGLWETKVVCTHVTPTGTERTKNSVTIALDDDQMGGLHGTFSGIPMSLALVPDPSSATKATIIGMSCAVSAELGGYTLHASVTAKEGSEKGTLKGTYLITQISPTAGAFTCKLKGKRVQATIPAALPGCT